MEPPARPARPVRLQLPFQLLHRGQQRRVRRPRRLVRGGRRRGRRRGHGRPLLLLLLHRWRRRGLLVRGRGRNAERLPLRPAGVGVDRRPLLLRRRRLLRRLWGRCRGAPPGEALLLGARQGVDVMVPGGEPELGLRAGEARVHPPAHGGGGLRLHRHPTVGPIVAAAGGSVPAAAAACWAQLGCLGGKGDADA